MRALHIFEGMLRPCFTATVTMLITSCCKSSKQICISRHSSAPTCRVAHRQMLRLEQTNRKAHHTLPMYEQTKFKLFHSSGACTRAVEFSVARKRARCREPARFKRDCISEALGTEPQSIALPMRSHSGSHPKSVKVGRMLSVRIVPCAVFRATSRARFDRLTLSSRVEASM